MKYGYMNICGVAPHVQRRCDLMPYQVPRLVADLLLHARASDPEGQSFSTGASAMNVGVSLSLAIQVRNHVDPGVQ